MVRLAMCWVLLLGGSPFRRQIAAGGPITLTHPEIIRYFMTIPEAARWCCNPLCSHKVGCLLDMGEPMRIKSLAEQMVRLSGLSLCDAANLMGILKSSAPVCVRREALRRAFD